MDVTVAVIPRERFRPLVASLQSLFKTISDDIPVIVVDGGAPEYIRQAVRDLQAKRDFQFITTDGFTLPNTARNLALDVVDTKYVAFCDNDLEYSPEWLENLVESAETNNAGAVAPTTLIGPSSPTLIHHAGGLFKRFHDKAGRPVLHSTHELMNVPLANALANQYADAPREPKNFEYHCVLVNTQAMRDIGGHDERMINSEHLDTSLRLLANGHPINYAPRSHIMYRAFDRFEDEDWPYFWFRWALHRDNESLRIFADNWGVYHDPRSLYDCFVLKHQKRAIRASGIKWPKPLLKALKMRRRVFDAKERRARKFDGRLPDPLHPRTLPKPPENGLDLAGIAWTDK